MLELVATSATDPVPEFETLLPQIRIIERFNFSSIAEELDAEDGFAKILHLLNLLDG